MMTYEMWKHWCGYTLPRRSGDKPYSNGLVLHKRYMAYCKDQARAIDHE